MIFPLSSASSWTSCFPPYWVEFTFSIWRSMCSVWPLFTCCFSDIHSSASLTVSPDSAQHFTSDSVSLSCEGNATEWRVKRFSTEGSDSSACFTWWGTMTGSTCNINTDSTSDAVYWCESGSGEFSNAVNITVQGMNSLHLLFLWVIISNILLCIEEKFRWILFLYLFQRCPGLTALHFLCWWLLGWFVESFLLLLCSFCFATEHPRVRPSSSVITCSWIIQTHTHTLSSWERTAV